jgi:sulfotransferase
LQNRDTLSPAHPEQSYYADIHPTQLVFDTNRLWTTKLTALARLFPQSRVICCVRNPAWVVDSIERLIRRNAFEPSGIFNCDAGGTVYSWVEGLSKGDRMVGFAWNAPREAVFGGQADRLLLVRYETLTANPLHVLATTYDLIGEAPFAHDPNHIEPAYDMIDFDKRLGTPGLHHVRSAVRAEKTRDGPASRPVRTIRARRFLERSGADAVLGADRVA